jgi:50S ribosomal protein L16 3-hydroxylase
MDYPLRLLNDLTPSEFLSDYWQKKPLLIRSAIPNFKGLLTQNELAGLACEDDVQARIIQLNENKWIVRNGPFDEEDFKKLPKQDWTLLVQSVNHHLPDATSLLALFNFIPNARLDDLMVSYAPNGGGVGAHFDSYDVFLLQGSGKRKWKISSQKDLSLIEDAPLRILKNFKTEEEWVLEAGDILYLPPQIAHWGSAVGDNCMTYSIGFRAPKKTELIYEFLSYLQDNIAVEGLYEDADLKLQAHPAEIHQSMLIKVDAILKKISWNKETIADFLGLYLTEPKAEVIFSPNRKISVKEFEKKLAKKPIRLDLKSQLLFYQHNFYLNGDRLIVPSALIDCTQKLADHRILDTPNLAKNVQEKLACILHEAYLAGFLAY